MKYILRFFMVSFFGFGLSFTQALAKQESASNDDLCKMFKDKKKCELSKMVQKYDEELNPNQGGEWASQGTFQIGDFPEVVGPEAISG